MLQSVVMLFRQILMAPPILLSELTRFILINSVIIMLPVDFGHWRAILPVQTTQCMEPMQWDIIRLALQIVLWDLSHSYGTPPDILMWQLEQTRFLMELFKAITWL